MTERYLLKPPVLWTKPNCVPLPSSYVEALIPSVTVFGDSAYKEVIQVNWGQRVGP